MPKKKRYNKQLADDLMGELYPGWGTNSPGL